MKQFLPKKKDEDSDGPYAFSYTKAYKNLLNELGDQAGQHELIAENLSTQVVAELAALVKALKDDRRKVSGRLFLFCAFTTVTYSI